MSTTESVNSLVRDLEQLANEANGKVLGGAYGLENLSGGQLTGGRAKGKKKHKKTKAGSHALRVKAYMKKHPKSTLGTASHAVKMGKK